MFLSSDSRYRLLAVADAAIALVLLMPLACMNWRGIWDLLYWYILRDKVPLNGWVMTLLGFLQMVGVMVLPLMMRHLDPSRKAQYWICTRVCLYLHYLTYCLFWCGLWQILDFYFPVSMQYDLLALTMSWLSLVLIGGCRSTIWLPFSVTLDTPENFKVFTRFDTKVSCFFLNEPQFVPSLTKEGESLPNHEDF